MFKNVASQKLIVFAFDATTNIPKTGDAANITAYVSKDYGAATVLGDTTATELDATNAKGYYLFDLTQAETNADTLHFTAKSATANIVVVGSPATVFPYPANFTATSIDASGRVDVGKIAGTAQTARDIGASVLLSSGTGTGQLSLSAGLVSLASSQNFINGGTGGVATSIASGGITAGSFDPALGMVPIRSGTAQAGAAGSITLDASASATTDFYKDAWVRITSNTGSGQARLVTAYNGGTKVATVAPNWATAPDNTSTFAVLNAANVGGVQGNVTGSVGSVTGNVGGNVTGS